MHKTTLYLDDDTRARIRVLARATQRTQAEVIRAAVAAYAPPPPAATSIGLGDSGRGDLSDRVDELLAVFGEDG